MYFEWREIFTLFILLLGSWSVCKIIVVNEQTERAKADYVAGMKSKDIAEKYGVSINTVKSWQKRQSGLERMHPKETKKYMEAIAAVSFGYAIPK